MRSMDAWSRACDAIYRAVAVLYRGMAATDRFFKSLWAFCALLLLTTGVFIFPYFVPVVPSVSMSYVTGFNNRAAVAAFVILGTPTALLIGRLLPDVRRRDKALPLWTLFATVIAMGLLAVMRRYHHWPVLGPEAFYALERQQHLDRGERLYRDFEFIYGPLLIYPGHWTTVLLRTSSKAGYLIAEGTIYGLSTAMIWFVVAKASLPTRYRAVVLVLLLIPSAFGLIVDGMNATPWRLYAAAALSLAVYLVWQRFRRPYVSAGLGVLAIALGMMISPEQGVALGLGLSAYGLCLAWQDRSQFPYRAALVLLCGTVLVFLIAFRSGELLSMMSLANGGLNFPFLPSAQNFFFFGTYLCGLGALGSALLRRDFDNVAVPLGLCGAVLLTSAFGRCDQSHLFSATPLYVVAMLSIASRRRLFRVWCAVAVCFLLPIHYVIDKISIRVSAHTQDQVQTEVPVQGASPVSLPIPQRTYYAPVALPLAPYGVPKWPLKSGFYYGIWNVTSPAAIQAKAEEIVRLREPFLLLQETNGRLPILFWDSEENVRFMQGLEGSYWAPRPKHPLPSTDPIRRAITQNYEPTAEAEIGWRIWKLR